MTVKDLIKFLKTLPPDQKVEVIDSEGQLVEDAANEMSDEGSYQVNIF